MLKQTTVEYPVKLDATIANSDINQPIHVCDVLFHQHQPPHTVLPV